jgi:uncharacterized protein YecE (DUF72 family)
MSLSKSLVVHCREESRVTLPYYLGCPVWASPDWVGKVFTPKAKRSDWLRQYSIAFNTVEGNSTFYGLPTEDTVRRWIGETEPGFRFVLKFPRTISHDRQLLAADYETNQFIEVLALLQEGGRLGPSFLQLPPQFSARHFSLLEEYLRKLPSVFPYAVEVRHADFFDAGPNEQRLDELLRELGIDRVLMDTRPLFSLPPTDTFEADSHRKKPRVPLRQTVTGTRPILRLIGRDDPELVDKWCAEWSVVVAKWIRDGRTPYIFTHAPHDLYAPDIARMFHGHVMRQMLEMPNAPAWPAETAPKREQQLKLF